MTDVKFPQADRCGRIEPFHVMALLARAGELEAQGQDILHLEVGEPDFPTPEPVMEAARRALDRGETRYTPAEGLPALREAIAGWYDQRFGVRLSPERIVVTPGASGALQLLLALLVNPGDGVLLPDPGYPCNRQFLELVNGRAAKLPLAASGGFRVTAADLRAAWGPDVVAAMLASPDNPTGNVLSSAELGELAQVARERGGSLIVDEIYQGLVHEGEDHTVLAEAPEALVINSFSKFFGMTGWRLGWLVAPEAHVPALHRMAQNFFIAPSTPAQHAALAAFDPRTLEELERRRLVLDERRRYLLGALRELGLPVMGNPRGAFYIYVDVSGVTDDSFAFCARLLEQEGLALTPGADFGAAHGPHRYLRIAYTCDRQRLVQAVERLQRFMERR